ncbi:hypothetical protein EFA46_005280 [Halarchaeum sp. CBA1220]|uniref:hypothetical protein n=1 Tax=Halarchaeum sp. CBA1220 TaxID=1853682 RepID=UPI000F3A8946|nr:hypothetical protein [Halarchaeum sp. CBA1220]QLC33634.1 hypothetical protein EFA46_005280 [Halarchaeum sp. CBA1220]
MTDVGARIDDEELEEFLEGVENQSEAVREGLRLLARERAGMSFGDLDDDQERALNWLLDNVGVGRRSELERIENRLAQVTSYDMELVRSAILRPLEANGYIRVHTGMADVWVVVCAPPSEEGTGEASSGRDDGVGDGGGVGSVEAQRERLDAAEPARADGGDA